MPAKILLQLDTDPQPSVFDAVVAIDAGVDHLLRHGNVTADNVRDLVYGGMFTRSPADLKSTAVFVGGSNVAAAEEVVARIQKTYFGPLRMSVLCDPNGSNTTAAAAVVAATRHLDLSQTQALVLAATGPVGSRVARLLARAGATVRVASRELNRAEKLCEQLKIAVPDAKTQAVAPGSDRELEESLAGCSLIVAAGAPGIALLPDSVRRRASGAKVLIDLNAVPPLGIAGVEPNDRGQLRDGVLCYGAIGVGGLKMKIHRRAVQRLFESNDQILDAEQVFELGRDLDWQRAV